MVEYEKVNIKERNDEIKRKLVIQEAFHSKLQHTLSEEYLDRMQRFQKTINMLQERSIRSLFSNSMHTYQNYFRTPLKRFLLFNNLSHLSVESLQTD